MWKRLHLNQGLSQIVQQYIEVFTHVHIELHILDLDELLIKKIGFGLLVASYFEFDLFQRSWIEQSFIHAFNIEK
jgi:hypothetical protein